MLALLDMHNEISKTFDNKSSSIGIFLDLSKAFDVINHKILLQKLCYYGIRGLPLQLLENYLSNRKQYVHIYNSDSSLTNISCGVPQGSILGPLFFIIFVNDIVYCSNILKFILYADDTNVFLTASNISNAITVANTELEKLSNWFKANCLMLNVNKSSFIVFSKNAKHVTNNEHIKIDNVIIKQVTSTKFLGVTIDSSLSWSYHINGVATKLSRIVGILHKLKFVLPKAALLKIYFSLFYSTMLYCVLIWGNADAKYINRIQVLQNKAIRAVLNAPYRSPTDLMYSKLKCLKLCELYSYQLAIFFFKLYKGYLPSFCQKYIISSSSAEKYDLRSHVIHNLAKTQCRQRHVISTGPILWDKIPTNIKSSTSLAIFKASVFKWLLSKYCNI